MADIDKLMGMADDTPVFAAYRIDYADREDIRFTEEGDERFGGNAKSPPPGHRHHDDVKDGYQRKIIVEDAATRDEVQAYLDGEDIGYVTEDVTPTQAEQHAIRRYGVQDEVDARHAITWNDALESADGVQDLADVQRGIHPTTGEEFNPPGKGKRQG